MDRASEKWYSWPQLVQTAKILLVYFLLFLGIYLVGITLFPSSGRDLGDGAYSDSPQH